MKQGGDYKSGGFTISDVHQQWQNIGTALHFRTHSARSHDNSRAGFTIVETLIVLAVTAALFIAAASLVSGRQNKTQFMTAINSLQQQLQQAINETSSGYYPNNNTFTCSGGALNSPPTFTSTAAAQGTNNGCIFLGKIIQFGLASDKSQFGIVPVVGNQLDGNSPSLKVARTFPRAMYPASGELSYVPSIITQSLMQNGLTVAASNATAGCPAAPNGIAGICYISVSGTKTPTGALAFLAGDSSGNLAATSGSNLQSGSQQLSLYGVKTDSPNVDPAALSQAVGDYTGVVVSNLEAATSASICIASGSTNQSGLIAIDAGLNVTLQVKDGQVC